MIYKYHFFLYYSQSQVVVVVVLVGVVGVGADRVRRQCSRRNEADCLYHGLSPSITQRCFQEHEKTEVVSQSGS